MAITALNDYAIGDVNFNTMMTTLDKAYKGKADITISAYATTAAPDVKVGSVFEDNGALFIVDTADITPGGYAGIASSTTFYLYYDESGGVFIFSSTAPTWSDALQGWYNGNDRAFFSMYKDAGDTLYENKYRLQEVGSIALPNDLKVSNNIILTTTTNKILHAADPLIGAVYDVISPGIPKVGDECIISGSGEWAGGGGGIAVFSRAVRGDATHVTLYGFDSVNSALWTHQETSGSGLHYFDVAVSLAVGPIINAAVTR